MADGKIVNRSDPQGSNGSKPYQAQLIARYGLRVPETLITNDPEAVLAFRDKHGAIIYKSISGVRSIVKELDDEDVARLDDIRWCPVQFQALVPGTDVRVHVIDQDVHATEIISDATDYRYARRSGGSTALRATKLRDDLAEQCVALTAGLGLAFAGIDLRLGPDGRSDLFRGQSVAGIFVLSSEHWPTYSRRAWRATLTKADARASNAVRSRWAPALPFAALLAQPRPVLEPLPGSSRSKPRSTGS